MKEKRKFISILFLFLIMVNFLIGNAGIIVNATGTNLVEDEITENLSNILALKNKINELKLDPLYLTDKALYEVTNYMEEEVLFLESELNSKKIVLEEGILLKDLIESSFTDKKIIYDTYFVNDETKIIPIEINDIKYMEYNVGLGINEEKTLLTKDEIVNALYNTYLKTTDEKITGYLSVFDTTKESYINTYNGVKTNKDNKVSELETKKLEITAFYGAEVLNGNTPNMVVADTEIKTYIENSINDLNKEVASYSFKEMAEKTNNLDTIYDDALDKINIFYLNNKSYTENGLKEKIENFNTSINEINNDLAQEIVVDDYKNEDITKLLEAVDDEFITVLKDIINDEETYEKLEEEINIYLDRKPSDKEEIDLLLENINNLRTYLNKDKALKIIELIVNNEDLTNEDNVDLLLKHKDILTDALKEKIEEAKLCFYELKLKDNTLYNMELVDDSIVLSYIKENLLKIDFINNLDYGTFKFEVIDEDNITNAGKVILYDRSDSLLKEYTIIIKGDINKDNIFDIKDLSEFEENLIKEELKDFVRLDLNNDKKINIYDVVIMKNLLETQQETSNATESNFKITERKCETGICYDVEIITNGVVKGFEFDLSASDNLTFEKLENNDLNINLNKDNTKVYGIGEFINGDNFTLCYKKDLSVSNTKVVGLNNVKFIYDNLNTNEVENIKIVTVEVEEKESSNVVNKTTPTYTYVEEPIVEEVIKEETIEEEQHIEEKEDEEELANEDNEVAVANVIKIIVIVLLGAVIIYFLNKKDNEDEEFLKNDK